jgi:transglutaminase-like putative cysteine protease
MLTRLKNAGDINTIIQEMNRLVDETVGQQDFLEFARNIVIRNPFEGSEQISAVKDFVYTVVKYQPDPVRAELFTSPHKMMELIIQGDAMGDCDDFAIFCAAIYRALGYNARIVLLDQTGGGFNHAATQVFSESANLWYYVDATRSLKVAPASSRLQNEPGSTLLESQGIVAPHYKLKVEV